MKFLYFILVAIFTVILLSCSSYKMQKIGNDRNSNHFQIQDFTLIPENDMDLQTGLFTEDINPDKFNNQANNAITQPVKNKESIATDINRNKFKKQKLAEFQNLVTKNYYKTQIHGKSDLKIKIENKNFESDKPKRDFLWPAGLFTILFGIILILLSILIPASGWDAVGLALIYIMGSFLVYMGALLVLAAIIKVTLKPNQSKGRKALSIITFILLGIILAFFIYYLAVYIFNIALA